MLLLSVVTAAVAVAEGMVMGISEIESAPVSGAEVPARSRRRKGLIIAGAAAAAVLAAAGSGAVAAVSSAHAPAATEASASSSPFWADDFDGAAGTRPDSAHWNTEVGNRDQEGWWNNELQYYTADAANSAVNGSGQLIISAREATAGQHLPCYPSGSCEYTSARLTTEGNVSLTYGRADIRAKIPTGQGLLPAIWMLGNNGQIWPAQGEIDIVEVVGGEPNTAYGTLHGPTYYNENGIGGTYDLGAAASSAWHVYSVIKQPEKITWLVDDEPYFELTPNDLPSTQDWVFEQDMHLLLNVAVGGDWPGDPDASTSFPAEMRIDYVHLYGEGIVDGVAVSSPN
ncbi:family 16 glycosylhydrolase [Microbacterium sp. NPDC058342]|uniref:glycoside hydrolase family 16 protein n=1 Tax=Microbacterium sp. NPDC058342 TaxID=3346454 RepID=UPI003647EC08